MLACLDGCSTACAPVPTSQRRFLDEDGFADDDEHAVIEGWLQKRNEHKALRWLWHTRYFRLEDGPGLLSFYASSIWQGCRRAGAFDVAQLSRVQMTGDADDPHLQLEFLGSEDAAAVIDLRPAGDFEELQQWAGHLQDLAEQLRASMKIPELSAEVIGNVDRI
mmetsp:Transcript_10528/g.23971  ORF Transcript_10528/g.23971 Transcript_10528/m.23971 type:complete len:164 (-) Transcript_10528:60-551(-)